MTNELEFVFGTETVNGFLESHDIVFDMFEPYEQRFTLSQGIERAGIKVPSKFKALLPLLENDILVVEYKESRDEPKQFFVGWKQIWNQIDFDFEPTYMNSKELGLEWWMFSIDLTNKLAKKYNTI